jgi:hypothetical protein
MNYGKGDIMKKKYIIILTVVFCIFLYFFLTSSYGYGVVSNNSIETIDLLNDEFIVNSKQINSKELEKFLKQEINNCRILVKNEIDNSKDDTYYKYEIITSRFKYFTLKKEKFIPVIYKMNQKCFEVRMD